MCTLAEAYGEIRSAIADGRQEDAIRIAAGFDEQERAQLMAYIDGFAKLPEELEWHDDDDSYRASDGDWTFKLARQQGGAFAFTCQYANVPIHIGEGSYATILDGPIENAGREALYFLRGIEEEI